MDKKIEALTKILTDFKEELGKNVNMSYSPQPNMAKDEPHKDDPKHEAKEKKIASKVKAEAQDLLDMHKEELMCSANGQWSLKKDAANPALAPKDKKIKTLQSQIDAGTYKPDPKKIADKMIKEEVPGEPKKMDKIPKKVKNPPQANPITCSSKQDCQCFSCRQNR